MNHKFIIIALFSIITIFACKSHTMVPNSQLKNIDALLTHTENRWDIRMIVKNAVGMSVQGDNETLSIRTQIDGNNLIASWSVDEARIKVGRPFKLTVKSETESFPVELLIPNSTKNGYTFVMIAKILTGH